MSATFKRRSPESGKRRRGTERGTLHKHLRMRLEFTGNSSSGSSEERRADRGRRAKVEAELRRSADHSGSSPSSERRTPSLRHQAGGPSDKFHDSHGQIASFRSAAIHHLTKRGLSLLVMIRFPCVSSTEASRRLRLPIPTPSVCPLASRLHEPKHELQHARAE